MLFLKGGRRLLKNMETILKNNYAISKMFTHQTCRYHAIENRRHCFLTNVCIMNFVSVTFLRLGLTDVKLISVYMCRPYIFLLWCAFLPLEATLCT
jgi:hypothetical protein